MVVDAFWRRKPPCPDPANFIWVQTKEGGFWRRKRGTVKKAELNESLLQNSENTKVSSPAARRIVSRLQPFMTGIRTGRLTTCISGKLRKGLNETGKLSFATLQDVDLQQSDHPMTRLLLAPFDVVRHEDELVVTIPISDITVRRHSPLVTGYFFDLVLLWGDAGEDGRLNTDSETSELFGIYEERKAKCRLRIPLPKEPWIALLKVSCMEGNEMAAANRNYGMRVIAVN